MEPLLFLPELFSISSSKYLLRLCWLFSLSLSLFLLLLLLLFCCLRADLRPTDGRKIYAQTCFPPSHSKENRMEEK